VAAGYPYYFAVILGSRHAAALGRLGYACAAVLVVAARPSELVEGLPCHIGAVSSVTAMTPGDEGL
jgi:hypothetical protein